MLISRCLCLAALILGAAKLQADEKDKLVEEKVVYGILAESPLTIVFRKVYGYPPIPDGRAVEWTYSINSAGLGERTIRYTQDLTDRKDKKPESKKFEVSAERMDAIRKSLRDERFFHLPRADGPVGLHKGWTTLTVVADDYAKTERFFSTDWRGWSEAELKIAAPAMRLFVTMCDAVDPDSKVFEELPKVKELVRGLKK